MEKLEHMVEYVGNIDDLVLDSDDKGRWITMRGTHVFVKKGQSPKEALETLLTKSKRDKWKKVEWKKAQHEKDKPAIKEQDRRDKYRWKKDKLKKELAKTKKDSKEWIKLIDKIDALRWKEQKRRREKAESDKQERDLSKFLRTKKDFTEDYPVKVHVRGGKLVKAHERGVKGKLMKEILLLKVEKLKAKKKAEEMILTEEDYAIVRFGASYHYPTYEEYLKKEKKRIEDLFGLDFILVGSLTEDTKKKKLKIFLSYSSLDHDYFNIPKIVESLEKYPEIEQVFYYIDDSGQNIVEFMEEGIGTSDVFVLFVSKNSDKSKSVLGEWQASYQRAKKGEMKIVPIYGKGDEDCIPVLLTPMLNVEFTKKHKEFIENLHTEIIREEGVFDLLTEDISLDECVSAKMSKMHHEGEDKKLTQEQMLGKAFGICRGDFTTDFIDSSQLQKITTDSYSNDFTVYHGSLTREGPFDYEKNGKKITVYKDYDNLSEKFSEADYFPLKAISGIGSHYTTVKGFTTNFELEDKPKEGNKYRHVYGDVIVLNDTFGSPEEVDLRDFHVSIGFKDHFEGDQQIIEYIDHLAMSDFELGRCITADATEGDACIVKKKVQDQNLNEVGT